VCFFLFSIRNVRSFLFILIFYFLLDKYFIFQNVSDLLALATRAKDAAQDCIQENEKVFQYCI
jgi:hypothetical protein